MLTAAHCQNAAYLDTVRFCKGKRLHEFESSQGKAFNQSNLLVAQHFLFPLLCIQFALYTLKLHSEH